MNWLHLTIFATLVSATNTLLQRYYLRDTTHDHLKTGAWYQIMSGVFVFSFALASGQLHIESNTFGLLVTLVISVLWTLGGLLYFSLIRQIEVSMIALVMTTRVLFTTLVGVVFLQESLNAQQILGIVCIFVGVLLVQQVRTFQMHWQAFVLTLFTAFIFGMGNIADRVATLHMNVYLYIGLSFFIPGLLMLGILKLSKGRVYAKRNRSHVAHILLVGLLTAITGITIVLGTIIAPTVTQVAFVSQLKTVIVVACAALLLHERTNIGHKIFAAVLCTIGLVLLA